MKHWYIVQVFRGQEDFFINRFINHEDYEVFTPKQVQLLKRKESLIKVIRPLFPGYIFIETDKEFKEFRKFYQEFMSIIDGCIRIIKYKDDVEALAPHERAFIERFIDKKKVIDSSIGFIEGDRIRIIEGPLIGNESLIRKINRHKRTALVEVTLFGEIQTIELSCEIIAKTDA